MAVVAQSSSSPGARPITPVRIQSVGPLGNGFQLMMELERDPLGFFTRYAREYGDLIPLRLGLTPTVLLSHPDLVEEVLVTRNHDFRKNIGTRRLASLLGNGLLLSEGSFWLRQRRLMQPAFHRQRLIDMGDTMVSITSGLLDRWRDGEIREISAETTELTLRIAARTLFGTDVAEDLARIRAASFTMTDHFRSRLFSLLILLPDWVPTPGNLRYQRAVARLNALVYRIIRERRVNGQSQPDVLDMLLRARDDGGHGMTDRQLRDEVMTLLLAGHETTALTLVWTLVLLARNPRVAEKLHAEVDQVLGGRPPTSADVQRLPYVEHVLAESLRLYPTAWVIGRQALRHTHIGGVRVPAGTNVLMSPWVLHRDPRFFEAPDEFRPERWADPDIRQLPRLAYVPFGGGQRVCIGSSFAQLETALVLATIAQRFALTLAAPAQPLEPLPVVTLRAKQPVMMRLAAR